MQSFTYFHPDRSAEVRTQPNGALPRSGDVWIRGAYGTDVAPDPLNVRVGEAGVEAWKIVLWLRLTKHDRERVLSGYAGAITANDIEPALWFYDLHSSEIDEQIERELEPV